MSKCVVDEARFIRAQEIELPTGRTLWARLYLTRRPGGRRIILRDDSGILFDTDEHYDMANAHNAASNWIAAQLELARCAHCNQINSTIEGAQDQESGRPVCDECVRKAAEVPTPLVTVASVEEIGEAVPSECPF